MKLVRQALPEYRQDQLFTFVPLLNKAHLSGSVGGRHTNLHRALLPPCSLVRPLHGRILIGGGIGHISHMAHFAARDVVPCAQEGCPASE
jgi:hypothetical protein